MTVIDMTVSDEQEVSKNGKTTLYFAIMQLYSLQLPGHDSTNNDRTLVVITKWYRD